MTHSIRVLQCVYGCPFYQASQARHFLDVPLMALTISGASAGRTLMVSQPAWSCTMVHSEFRIAIAGHVSTTGFARRAATWFLSQQSSYTTDHSNFESRLPVTV
jgi:hypothetical protein